MKKPVLLFLSIAVALIVVCTLLAILFFRLVPVDPAAWHVDPLTVEEPASDNYVLLRPGEGLQSAPSFQATPSEVAAALREVAGEVPRTGLVAESADGLHMTFVVRSQVMGFPDFLTVKVLATDEGATLAIFSRSQYGYSDFGVNKDRVKAWLDRLESRLSE